MVGIDDMAEWHMCKRALYDGENDGRDDIQPRSLGMHIAYNVHIQIICIRKYILIVRVMG